MAYYKAEVASKPDYDVLVTRWANSAASAGFTGTSNYSIDKSGSGSVYHGYHGLNLYFNWDISDSGVAHFQVYFGGLRNSHGRLLRNSKVRRTI